MPACRPPTLSEVWARLQTLLLALSIPAVNACSHPLPAEPAPHLAPEPQGMCRPQTTAPLPFERSPGGVPEVDPQWVVEHGCQVRLIDVREADELQGPLGHIEGVEHVPLRQLDRRAAEWDPTTPVVLICRSGRRSSRGVALLESQGFEHVASMTGGMQRWVGEGLPTQRRRSSPTDEPSELPPGEPGPLTTADIEHHLGSPDEVRWVKAAALLLQGVESCVDGRDAHPVIGTLGGDAGELLLGLASVEQQTGHRFSPAEVDALLGAHLEAFGRFYLHTDEHALSDLGRVLLEDPRWADHRDALRDVAGLSGLLLHPPRDLEPDLLDRLVEPDHVGCGHLRLVLEHPDDYGVRPGLTHALLRAFFRRRWGGDPRLDYVVLAGEHHEGAIVQVVLPHAVQTYSRVPAVAPRHRRSGRALFVAHPQLSAYLRDQSARWLVEQLGDSLGSPLDAPALVDRQQRLATRQLDLTLHHLAAGLPIYEATPRDERWTVTPRGTVPTTAPEPQVAPRPSAATSAETP